MKLSIGQPIQFRHSNHDRGTFTHYTYHEGFVVASVDLKGGDGVLVTSTQPDGSGLLWTPYVLLRNVIPGNRT